MKDIYFEKNYGRLYEQIEKGVCEEFVFDCDLGIVRHLFIKREIQIKWEDGIFYDLLTPYGYGGPRIEDCREEDKPELVVEFRETFGDYCLQNNIVSEFVRFHPVFRNDLDFNECYAINFKRKTIQTDLAGSDDPILNEYSASCRRDIRRALKAGVEYNVIFHPEDLKDFKEIYYSTMKRNSAESVYYFDQEYFRKCVELLGEYLVIVEVLHEGRIIGMSLNFACGDYIHAHLTGTLKEFHKLAPAYVLQYALALWGKEQGKKLIHHGGGRTGDADDKLYLFKKKFGRNQEFDYFTGQKVWNPVLYESLCQAAKVPADTDHFPAYRFYDN